MERCCHIPRLKSALLCICLYTGKNSLASPVYQPRSTLQPQGKIEEEERPHEHGGHGVGPGSEMVNWSSTQQDPIAENMTRKQQQVTNKVYKPNQATNQLST